jgi:hypothetical protein
MRARPRSDSQATFVFLAGVSLLVSLTVRTPLLAQGARSVLGDLIRGTARVSEDVPIRDVEQVVKDMKRSRATREAVDAEIREGGRALEGARKTKAISRADEVIELLRETTAQLDPRIFQRLKVIDEGSREAALVLARGGKEIERTIPDLAGRARFLQEGGADTVAAIGTFGQDAAREAIRLNEAIRAGSLVGREGSRTVSLADFGRIMSKGGEASWTFWKKYVRPHRKAWLTTGALAAYLAAPESFQDAAGGLTEAGFQRLTELAGSAAAAAIRGFGKGSGKAAEQVEDAIRDTFLTGRSGRYAIIGASMLLLVSTLIFRRIRHFAMGPFRWLQRVPGSKAGMRRRR